MQDLTRQTGGHYQVNLWRGKTDQDNEGTIKTLSEDITQRIDAWLAITGIEQGPLFRPLAGKANSWAKGLSDKALSTTSGRAAIRRCLLKVGITNVSDFGGHSTRIGGAMDVREKTGSDQDVIEYGNWKSPMMPMRYTEQLARERNPIHDVDNIKPVKSDLSATPEDYFIVALELDGPSWAEDKVYNQVRVDIETNVLKQFGAVPVPDTFEYRIPVPKTIGTTYFKALIDAIDDGVNKWLEGEVFFAECSYWTASRGAEWCFSTNDFDLTH